MVRKAGRIGTVEFTTSTTSRVRSRKSMDMDLRKLAVARRVLGTRTDTETVDQALELVAFHGDVFSALDRLAANGGLSAVFERPDIPRAGRGASRRTR